MKNFDVCIIGAGASGLMAASYLADSGKTILVLEGTKEIGKKLSLTGNGRCNITNENIRSSCFYSSDDSFVSKIFNKVSNERLLKILSSFSISVKNVNGYYYPNSFSAKSVVNAFSFVFDKENVSILFDSKIREIKKEGDTFFMYGERQKKDEERPIIASAKNVILSCGGESYPKTGSDGAGYKLLYRLGHTIKKTLPALCPLNAEAFDKTLSGLRQSSKAALYINSKVIRESQGEVQFTKEGLSGICIFEISSPAVRALDLKEEVEIILDYLPEISFEELKEILENRLEKSSRSILDSLITLLPEKLLLHVLNKSKIKIDKKAKDISDNEMEIIIRNIKEDRFKINGNGDFKTSQTTSGGVLLEEIDDNMMSRIVPNLYVTGELLDVDGICGGYNLYLAFSTAIIASDRILKNDTN